MATDSSGPGRRLIGPSLVRSLAALATLALAACDRSSPRPWEGAPAGSELAPAPPFPSAPALEPARDAAASATDGAASDELVTPVRVGGPWVSCYGSFRPSGEPIRDVTRLSLLCGPSNGMQRVSTQAEVGAVSEGEAPISTTLRVKAGECYRVFACAEATVADLDVVVRSSRGAAIASDHGEDGWPIVQPDRPLCLLEDDTLTVEVSARRGQGRFASEIWRLRAKN